MVTPIQTYLASLDNRLNCSGRKRWWSLMQVHEIIICVQVCRDHFVINET
jgi:hypothetical protein